MDTEETLSDNETNSRLEEEKETETTIEEKDLTQSGETQTEAVQLFVGHLPFSYTEEDIRVLFEVFGKVIGVKIITNKANLKPAGCCFVTFTSIKHAEAAISAYNEIKVLPGLDKPMSVRFAHQQDAQNKEDSTVKLYVCKLSQSTTEKEVRDLFEPFGKIVEIFMMKENGLNKGTCFVKYETHTSAKAAIDHLNGLITVSGSTVPLEVRIAENRPPMKKTPLFSGMFGILAHPVLGKLTGDHMNAIRSSNVGPPGANLFIMNIPFECDDVALYTLFIPFGRIVSARIFVDKKTGSSRGFGFVSYANIASANIAVEAMNGYELRGRKLRVQIKAETSGVSRPY